MKARKMMVAVATLALMGAMACVAAACSPSTEPLSQSGGDWEAAMAEHPDDP